MRIADGNYAVDGGDTFPVSGNIPAASGFVGYSRLFFVRSLAMRAIALLVTGSA